MEHTNKIITIKNQKGSKQRRMKDFSKGNGSDATKGNESYLTKSNTSVMKKEVVQKLRDRIAKRACGILRLKMAKTYKMVSHKNSIIKNKKKIESNKEFDFRICINLLNDN